MTYLNKISITNIRRFKEDVEIEIGPGATIIIAPNGTGKTSLFEALEFALTGSVQRLKTNLEPLIRANQSFAKVRLDFDSDIFCESIIEKGENPSKKGVYKDLFGTVAEKDIPFLLRLTHILTQQGKDWFVQADEDSAGQQLNSLSIGRDASIANSKIISAKKAANEIQKGLEKKFNEEKKEIESWNQLLQERDNENSIITGTLLPLNELKELLIDISNILKYKRSDTINDELASIDSFHSEIRAYLYRLIDENNNYFISIESIKSIVDDFYSAESMIDNILKKIESLEQDKKNHNSKIEELNKTIDLKLNSLDDESNKKTKLLNIQHKREVLEQKINEQKNIISLIELNKEKIDSLFTLLENKKSTFQNDEANYNKNIELTKNQETLLKRKGEIQSLNNEIDNWNNSVEQLNVFNKSKNECNSKIEENKIKLDDLKHNYQESYVDLENSRKIFDAVNKTNDVIKEAVGVIVAKYPENKTDCPVCLQSYSLEELRRRMTESINLINPELDKIRNKLKNSENKFEANKINLNILNETHEKARLELDSIDIEIKRLNIAINQNIKPKFPIDFSLQDAIKHVSDLKKENDKSISSLQLEKSKLTSIPSYENISTQKSLLEQLEKEYNDVTQKIEDHSKKNEIIITIIQSINEELKDNNLSNINIEIENQDKILLEINNDIEKIKSELTNKKYLIRGIEESILDNVRLQSRFKSSINEYLAKWANAKLIEKPSKEILTSTKTQIQLKNELYIQKKTEIDTIDNQLTLWKASQKHLSINRNIKNIMGNYSESEYTIFLEEKFKIAKSEFDAFNTKNQSLVTFGNLLGQELVTVNTLIKPIENLWKNLLNRVVVDPRFANTSLNPYTSYNKQKVTTSVELSGKSVQAMHIASEAQLTDLQLTFQLAMAQKYQWSRWKGLLLDDPTQHHDLVHASGVFDLLRDYIADLKFQVVLSTHDSVHASFLIRKLQNDGINVKVWQLTATGGGVHAIPG